MKKYVGLFFDFIITLPCIGRKFKLLYAKHGQFAYNNEHAWEFNIYKSDHLIGIEFSACSTLRLALSLLGFEVEFHIYKVKHD